MGKIAATLLRPGWLTGPILGKELRVSSRRRRYYVLRFVYLALLLLFTVIVWLGVVPYGTEVSPYYVAQMAEAGKGIVAAVGWFQFITCQLVAIVLLSTAVSDEITHGTLGLLMTTPVGSFQIVAGKLLSRLWQLLLLLAISLPVLAVVRVFGGVPLDFVLGAVCITVCTCIFLGSISLWFSIFDRRSYTVILKTIFTAGVLFLLLPWMAFMVWEGTVDTNEEVILWALLVGNPYGGMVWVTGMLFDPGGAPTLPLAYGWWLNCAALLLASGVVLAGCTLVVRRVASRQAAGEAGLFPKRRFWRAARSLVQSKGRAAAGRIRRVRGLPMVWKELRSAGNRRKLTIVGIAALLLLLITYLLCAADDGLDDVDTHVVYSLVFLALGMLGTMAVSGAAIASEKEARTMPLLLVTNISDRQVVFAKVVGVLRRSLPYWVPWVLHLALFSLVGYIRPEAWGQVLWIIAWVTAFLTGTGLYFSACFRRTTTAVVMNLAVIIGLWAVMPVLLIALVEGLRESDDAAELYVSATPWAHAVVVMMEGSGEYNADLPASDLSYNWPDGNADLAETNVRLLGVGSLYVVVGLLLTWRAGRRLRRNVF
jgi:ABC-type transport system involved in multi-copper enzyme maturation permease subunit